MNKVAGRVWPSGLDHKREQLDEAAGQRNDLLKWTYSASGGWWIRKGNYITLDEMLYFGGRTCSCFNLYRANVSNTGGATERRNAKGLRYQGRGKWGLPRRC